MDISSYRWGDPEGSTVIGITSVAGLTYTFPTSIANREYNDFVAIGTQTAAPYVDPLEVVVPDYMSFWVGLITSDYYTKVKVAASTDLATNTSATEFIALLGDAKAGARIEPILQVSFNELLSLVPANAEDQAFLDYLLETTGLSTVYDIQY